MLQTINYEDLMFIDEDAYSSGTYGIIKRCIFDGKLYVCKEFKDSSYLTGKKRMLNELSKIKNPNLCTPKFWIKKKDKISRYLMDFCDGKDISAFEQYPIKEKVNLLKKVKDLILSMHEVGIIHSDLIGSNIMVSGMNPYIIDFDNASFKRHKTCLFDVGDLSQEFINKYGIKKEIDIYIFNILTFSIINECDFYLSRKNVLSDNFGFFNNKEGRKICNGFFLDNKTPNDDFLIDTLNENSFTI